MTHSHLDALRALSDNRLLMLCAYAVRLFTADTIYDRPLDCDTLTALDRAVNARLNDDLDHDLISPLNALLTAHKHDDRSHVVVMFATDLNP